MKFSGRSLLAFSVLAVASAPLLFAFDVSPGLDGAWAPGLDEVWAQFRQPVLFADRLLPAGKYLIVHDDDKSARMEPCLYVYAENDLDAPLVAIHCVRRVETPTERDKIVWGTIRRDNVREFGYVQFAGDLFAHYAR